MFLRVCARADEGNQELQEFLASRNPKQQHSSTLESYLIKPIQRILKYPLLLTQLRNSTDTRCEEHLHLAGEYWHAECMGGMGIRMIITVYLHRKPYRGTKGHGEGGRAHQRNAAHPRGIRCHIRPSVPTAPKVVQTADRSQSW